MWTADRFLYENKLILLAEGQADRRLLEKLIQAKRLPAFDCPWPVYHEEKEVPTEARLLHSADKFVDMLKALDGDFERRPELLEKIVGVLIVADAKDEPKATFAAIRRQVEKVPKFPLPSNEGEVARNGTYPALTIILLPGAGMPGSLETLYVRALGARYRSAAKCVEKFLKCGTINISKWNIEKQSKARLHCLVAATHEKDPSAPAAHVLSIKKNGKQAIAMTQSCFDPIHQAIRKFCKELGVRR